MKKGRNGLVKGLTILMAVVAFVMFVALPTATNIGVVDAHGCTGAHVLVPVNITNVQDGPVPSLIFDIKYDNSVINVSGVQKGALTENWQTPAYCNHEWGTRVAVFYDSVDEHAIQNGSTGSVVVLNFSVNGELGATSVMDLSNIQLAEGAPDYQIGTAPAKNGTFTVQLGDVTPGKITGQIKTITGTVMEGVTVTLTANDSSEVLETTTTNETGYFNLTTVEAAEYYVNSTKLRYWDNSTLVTVQSGETKTVNVVLSRKGDLNDNERSADAGDVTLMLRASVYKLDPDWRFDLNNNARLADAGDVTLMLRASVYKLELL